VGYTIVTSLLRVFGQTAGWAPGSEWFFIDIALLVADVALYRDAAKPQHSA